jgi:SNF2 family DNA or RNA helicase
VRFALTGTPIENALSELWSVFDFVMPGFLFGASKFTRHYEAPIMKENDGERSDELRRQIAPFILRRVKGDVLKELPDKIETAIYAEMTDEQRKLYTAYLLETKGELQQAINQGEYKTRQIEILSMLTRLRQICCHPATFVEGYNGGSGKLAATEEVVLSRIESGSRVLIFSQFTKMLNIIEETLLVNGVPYFYLDGQTPAAERLKSVDRFNGGERKVFLISLKAGGAGLNLTGADVVIHYDPWWNPAVMDQASGRAHRFGQKRIVQVVKIVARNSIEERIMELQEKKRDLIDKVIQEGAVFLSKMSQDEIMGLFV